MFEDDIRIATSATDRSVVVSVRGEIDAASVPALRAALQSVRASEHVVVDLGEVSFIDSAGLGVLVGHAVQLHKVGATFRIGTASREVRRLFEIAGVSDLLEPRAWANVGIRLAPACPGPATSRSATRAQSCAQSVSVPRRPPSRRSLRVATGTQTPEPGSVAARAASAAIRSASNQSVTSLPLAPTCCACIHPPSMSRYNSATNRRAVATLTAGIGASNITSSESCAAAACAGVTPRS